MPRLTTAADRAALARRRGRPSTVLRDPCPLCGNDLAGARSTTRRRVVFSSVPGTFRWRCPDCSGVWEQSAPQPAPPPVEATLAASRLNSAAGTAGP